MTDAPVLLELVAWAGIIGLAMALSVWPLFAIMLTREVWREHRSSYEKPDRPPRDQLDSEEAVAARNVPPLPEKDSLHAEPDLIYRLADEGQVFIDEEGAGWSLPSGSWQDDPGPGASAR